MRKITENNQRIARLILKELLVHDSDLCVRTKQHKMIVSMIAQIIAGMFSQKLTFWITRNQFQVKFVAMIKLGNF